MSHPVRPLALIATAAVVAWLVSAGSAQPPAKFAPDPALTAFPDLKVPLRDAPGGQETDFGKALGRLAAYPKPIPPDAPPLRKVKLAQLNEGAEYIKKTHQVFQVGRWMPQDLYELMRTTAEVYRVGAELADNAAEKVGWYEDRVVMFKVMERFTDARVHAGSDPPQAMHLIGFWRLQAEADLLEVKAGKK
jgi:hypothetical protein